MSQTLPRAGLSKSKKYRGLFAGPARLLVVSFLVFASIVIAVPADSTAVDSPAVAARVDSSVTDSTVPANAADSVIQRLAQARSDGQGNQPLDLKFESPAKIFSVKNISMVLIVIGLLVLFMHFLRKYLYKPIGGPAAGGQFQVVRQFHLGPRKSVALVRFAGKLLLLGVTDSAINTLAEIDDPEEVERVLADAANPAANAAGAFKDIYHNLLSRSGKGSK